MFLINFIFMVQPLIFIITLLSHILIVNCEDQNYCENRSLFPKTLKGQHYRSTQFFRKDIRDGSGGVSIFLKLRIMDFKKCKPMEGINVEIWHANAIGNYSTYSTFTEPPNPSLDNSSSSALLKRSQAQSSSKDYLRGVQKSSKNGYVKFITIFPGWIKGRTSHIHLNVKVFGRNHFGQFYFSEFLKEHIIKTYPYTKDPYYITPNQRDCEFLCYGGIVTVVNLQKRKKKKSSKYDSYRAFAVLGFSKNSKARLKSENREFLRAKLKEYGVKCYKPNALGVPTCKLLNVEKGSEVYELLKDVMST